MVSSAAPRNISPQPQIEFKSVEVVLPIGWLGKASVGYSCYVIATVHGTVYVTWNNRRKPGISRKE